MRYLDLKDGGHIIYAPTCGDGLNFVMTLRGFERGKKGLENLFEPENRRRGAHVDEVHNLRRPSALIQARHIIGMPR